MKKRLLGLLFTSILVLSLLTPAFASTTDEQFNVERYTDRVDIDGKLNQLANDPEFQKQAEVKIKESAAQVFPTSSKGKKPSKNSDETTEAASTSTESAFTFDGGTKYFLNYELAFKSFTLRSVGEHVEVWVANDLSFPVGDLRPAHVVTQAQVDILRDEFDNNIYPVDTQFFGMPDSHDGSYSLLADWGYVPEGYYEGDGDKIIMLVDNIRDDNYYDSTYPFFVAGFYWGTLENYIDRNIITIDTNSWATRLENTFYGTTIHELQHLIHADNDGDETSWVNEGMSTFSEFLGGYGMDAGSINFLLDHPENSLTNWDDQRYATTGPETIADYGLTQLFSLYIYEQFGKEFIREIALSPYNSIESYEKALENNNINMSFQDVFKNFTTALLVDDTTTNSGIYGFKNIDLRKLPVDKAGTERGMTVNFEKAALYEKDGVPAWGADYKVLDFTDKIRSISFDGVDFLPIPWKTVADPQGSGEQVYWGNQGDEADNALIFKADLTNVSNATLIFDNFIDIEEQWDFGVVQVSTDGGNSWTSLANDNTRSDVVEEGYPKIKENLPGFTGYYEDWTAETFDLSAYAGQEIYVSFRYLTDWGYNDTGWFVDNIQIPEIGLLFDGSSMDNLMSNDQLTKNYVEYAVTFIQEKDGNYKVIDVDPFNVTEENALQLRQLFLDGTTYMKTWYAAQQDSLNPVDFEYEVLLKTQGPKK